MGRRSYCFLCAKSEVATLKNERLCAASAEHQAKLAPFNAAKEEFDKQHQHWHQRRVAASCSALSRDSVGCGVALVFGIIGAFAAGPAGFCIAGILSFFIIGMIGNQDERVRGERFDQSNPEPKFTLEPPAFKPASRVSFHAEPPSNDPSSYDRGLILKRDNHRCQCCGKRIIHS